MGMDEAYARLVRDEGEALREALDRHEPASPGFDWPVLLIFALVLVTAAGTAYVAVNG